MKKRFRISLKAILIIILLSAVIFTGFEVYKYQKRSNNQAIASVDTAQSNQEIIKNEATDNKYIQDITGEEITKVLKQRDVDMGFINSKNIVRLNHKIPIAPRNADKAEIANLPKHETLDYIKPVPDSSQQKNMLIWDEFNIKVPLLYASFQDIFQADNNGVVDFDKLINNDPTSSPVQQLLTQGIVHLPFSPLPGEQGNSYIIGHSSNYSTVKSDYNYVFAPLIEKTKPDQTFRIYDYVGRDLTFKVFESLAVKEDNVAEAYKNFGDRRVVTLQGSILENVDGKLIPTKRWLVRAELVI